MQPPHPPTGQDPLLPNPAPLAQSGATSGPLLPPVLGRPLAAPGLLGATSADQAVVGDCQAMIARLYHFLDGELTDVRRETIMGHLEQCPSCFSAYDFEAELRIVVRERSRSHVPPSLLQRIRSAIDAERGSC